MSAEMGRNRVKVSHLQYTDDNLFIVEADLSNAVSKRRILKLF